MSYVVPWSAFTCNVVWFLTSTHKENLTLLHRIFPSILTPEILLKIFSGWIKQQKLNVKYFLWRIIGTLKFQTLSIRWVVFAFHNCTTMVQQLRKENECMSILEIPGQTSNCKTTNVVSVIKCADPVCRRTEECPLHTNEWSLIGY